jgi:glycosyltransferase involved in cell wall biosynthesis
MPRVALFCTNFLPYSQSFVYEQIRKHERYAVEVFAWRRFFPDRFPFTPVHLAEPHYIATRKSARFEQRFREQRFDIAHAHFGPGGAYALPFAERVGIPLVVTFHGYDVPLLSSRKRFYPLHWPYALRSPELLRKMQLGLCASNELRDMLLELGVPESKLCVYRLGIDLERFRPLPKNPDQPLVVMVGRFVEKKGFEDGLLAFARAARGRPAKLVLVGSGPLEGRLRALAANLSLQSQVEFPGPSRPEEVAALLGRADVLLAPSFVTADGNRESGLIVVKEASACRAVPVGTRHGGIPEIIDHAVTGFLVPERGISELAARLTELLDSPTLRERMGYQARLKMEREYDNRERVPTLEAIYDECIRNKVR